MYTLPGTRWWLSLVQSERPISDKPIIIQSFQNNFVLNRVRTQKFCTSSNQKPTAMSR